MTWGLKVCPACNETVAPTQTDKCPACGNFIDPKHVAEFTETPEQFDIRKAIAADADRLEKLIRKRKAAPRRILLGIPLAIAGFVVAFLMLALMFLIRLHILLFFPAAIIGGGIAEIYVGIMSILRFRRDAAHILDDLPHEFIMAFACPPSPHQVREAAVQRVSDLDALLKIAQNDKDDRVRRAAAECASQLGQMSSLASPSGLATHAVKHSHPGARECAVNRLQDQSLLEWSAKNDPNVGVRLAAIRKLVNPRALQHAARWNPPFVRRVAKARLAAISTATYQQPSAGS